MKKFYHSPTNVFGPRWGFPKPIIHIRPSHRSPEGSGRRHEAGRLSCFSRYLCLGEQHQQVCTDYIAYVPSIGIHANETFNLPKNALPRERNIETQLYTSHTYVNFRLAEDHVRARALADILSKLPWVSSVAPVGGHHMVLIKCHSSYLPSPRGTISHIFLPVDVHQSPDTGIRRNVPDTQPYASCPPRWTQTLSSLGYLQRSPTLLMQ